MKYMLLIHSGDGVSQWEKLPEDEQKAILGEYMAISQAPGVTGGDQLQPPETATTVRVQDGRTLTTDGPFAETKDALGGYYQSRPTTSTPPSSWPPGFPRRPGRRDRGSPGGGALSELDSVFRDEWGPGPSLR